jgi:hypothetical protein
MHYSSGTDSRGRRCALAETGSPRMQRQIQLETRSGGTVDTGSICKLDLGSTRPRESKIISQILCADYLKTTDEPESDYQKQAYNPRSSRPNGPLQISLTTEGPPVARKGAVGSGRMVGSEAGPY